MAKLFKGKVGTVIVVMATFLLAGVAIFTALRLYQLREQPVAPNVPSSIPKAAEGCSLTFTVTATESASPSPTATSSATPTGTPNPSATPNSCNGSCGGNENCLQPWYFCFIETDANGVRRGHCRDINCREREDCTCPGISTSTPTPTIRSTGTPRPSATPAAALPESGTNWPTVMSVGVGLFVIIGSLLLAI